MDKRTKVLFGIYMRKALPWLLMALMGLLLFFAAYPYFYEESDALGDAGVLYSIQKILQYSLIWEMGVVYALAYYLYYSAISENEHIFLGSLPVARKKQYSCMTGSLFFIIFCLILAENAAAGLFWNGGAGYPCGLRSALCRLVLLLFLACFFLWLFQIFMAENWWNSVLILAGLLTFLFCLIRLTVTFAYLFGSEHNILVYQLQNIWYCLTDIYTKESNPAQLRVCSAATQTLYGQRNVMTIAFCVLFLLFMAAFFLWGRRGFCRYGHLGKLKKWVLGRSFIAMLCMSLWGAVYIGALGSMEMSWYKMTAFPRDGHMQEEADWSDFWFIQRIEIEEIPYLDEELFESYSERADSLPEGGGEATVETTALLGGDRTSITGKLDISAWDRGMAYCIPKTEGTWWAKLQFLVMICLGAGLGLLPGVRQRRELLTAARGGDLHEE